MKPFGSISVRSYGLYWQTPYAFLQGTIQQLVPISCFGTVDRRLSKGPVKFEISIRSMEETFGFIRPSKP